MTILEYSHKIALCQAARAKFESVRPRAGGGKHSRRAQVVNQDRPCTLHSAYSAHRRLKFVMRLNVMRLEQPLQTAPRYAVRMLATMSGPSNWKLGYSNPVYLPRPVQSFIYKPCMMAAMSIPFACLRVRCTPTRALSTCRRLTEPGQLPTFFGLPFRSSID